MLKLTIRFLLNLMIKDLGIKHFIVSYSFNNNRYRSSKEERAVKVYTVAQESNYLVIRNISAVGVGEELIQLLASYGTILEYRYLDDIPAAPYTEVMWVKFKDVQSAMYFFPIFLIFNRDAKVKMNKTSFYGLDLFIMYGPEYESVQETLDKLEYRRKTVHQRIIANKLEEGQSLKGIKPINLKPIKSIVTESEKNDNKNENDGDDKKKKKEDKESQSSLLNEQKEEMKEEVKETDFVNESIANKVNQKLHSLKKKAEEEVKKQMEHIEPKKKRRRI